VILGQQADCETYMTACLELESLELLHESYRAGIAQGFFIEADRIVLKVVEAILLSRCP
jgi:hypothetical protein